jgi:hypothetical protein
MTTKKIFHFTDDNNFMVNVSPYRVAPGESALFGGSPGVELIVDGVRVFGRTEAGVPKEIPAAFFRGGHLSEPEDPELCMKLEVVVGRVQPALATPVGSYFIEAVNHCDEPIVMYAACAEGVLTGGSGFDVRGERAIFSMIPVKERQPSRRIALEPLGIKRVSRLVGAGKICWLLARSDSRGDIDISDPRISNFSYSLDHNIPIEFFEGAGWQGPGANMRGSGNFGFCVCNKSEEPRWAEFEFEVEMP